MIYYTVTDLLSNWKPYPHVSALVLRYCQNNINSDKSKDLRRQASFCSNS